MPHCQPEALIKVSAHLQRNKRKYRKCFFHHLLYFISFQMCGRVEIKHNDETNKKQTMFVIYHSTQSGGQVLPAVGHSE